MVNLIINKFNLLLMVMLKEVFLIIKCLLY